MRFLVRTRTGNHTNARFDRCIVLYNKICPFVLNDGKKLENMNSVSNSVNLMYKLIVAVQLNFPPQFKV